MNKKIIESESIIHIINLCIIMIILISLLYPVWQKPSAMQTKGDTVDATLELSIAYVTYDAWKKYGEVPLWCHYFGGGIPFSGHYANRNYSPWILPLTLFGEVIGLKLIFSLIFIGSGLGMYGFLLKWVDLNKISSCVAATLYVSSTWFATRIYDANYIEISYLLLPLYLLALYYACNKIGYIILPAVVLNIVIADGKFAIFLFVGVGFYLILAGRKFEGERLRVAILAWLFSSIAAFFLSAPKIIPLLEVLQESGIQREAIKYSGLSLGEIKKAITEYRFYSFGIGLPAFVFVVTGGVLQFKRAWPYVVLGAVTLLLMMGEYSFIPFYKMLGMIPFLNKMWNIPKHVSAQFLFCVVVCFGLFFDFLLTLSLNTSKGTRIIIITGVVSAAIVCIGSPFLRSVETLSSVFNDTVETVDKHGDFYYVKPATLVAKGTHGQRRSDEMKAFSNYHNMRRNIGTLDYYGSLLLPENAVPRYIVAKDSVIPNPDYWGEVRFIKNFSREKPKIIKRTYNTLSIEVPARRIERVILVNQNYHKDWSSSVGDVYRRDGLIAIRIPMGEKIIIKLSFRHKAFYSGLLMSLLCIFGLVFLLIFESSKNRKSKKLGPVAAN